MFWNTILISTSAPISFTKPTPLALLSGWRSAHHWSLETSHRAGNHPRQRSIGDNGFFNKEKWQSESILIIIVLCCSENRGRGCRWPSNITWIYLNIIEFLVENKNNFFIFHFLSESTLWFVISLIFGPETQFLRFKVLPQKPKIPILPHIYLFLDIT